MWEDILSTTLYEFSDLMDVKVGTKVFIRLSCAAALGSILGYERERSMHDAGVRTHMLVALGTCLFVVAPLVAGTTINDMSRVIQGIIQGVGFLGIGTIVVGTANRPTKGLTTAASIWATAGVGVAAGLGMQATAVMSTIFMYVILTMIRTKYKQERLNNGA